jgi:Male sterility protein
MPSLLAEQETAVRLLIRPRSEQHLDERFTQLFDFWGRDSLVIHAKGRLQAFSGDVCSPRLVA